MTNDFSISARESATDVLFVVGSFDVGGAERHLTLIASALARRGWRVTIYSLSGRGPALELFGTDDVGIICPPLERGSGREFVLRRLLRIAVVVVHLLKVMLQHRSAAVHFFLPSSYLIGAPLAIIAGIKRRVMSRRSLNRYQSKNMLIGPLERLLHPFMTAILGNSRSVMRELEAEGVHAGRLGLIYNGVDTSIFAASGGREQTRRALGIQDSTLVLAIVANLIPYKGHLDLVEALGQSAREMPDDWKLLIVGRDDGAGAAIKTLAEMRGLADKLLFVGPRKDVSELLAASDIGLLASHEEGFSNAVIEGMYARLPMIVTDVGGNGEAVIDGENGLVVPPHDPSAFGRAIVRLAADPALRAKYGANGRRRVETHFTLDSCVGRYEALYRGLQASKIPRDIVEIQYRT